MRSLESGVEQLEQRPSMALHGFMMDSALWRDPVVALALLGLYLVGRPPHSAGAMATYMFDAARLVIAAAYLAAIGPA